jgi:hypothetical protein
MLVQLGLLDKALLPVTGAGQAWEASAISPNCHTVFELVC